MLESMQQFHAILKVVWMKNTLVDYKIHFDDPIHIYYDNTSSIDVSKILVMHFHTKHIPIKYYYLKEQVANNTVKLEYISSKEQVADIFTKPLPRDRFEYLLSKLRTTSLDIIYLEGELHCYIFFTYKFWFQSHAH